jgi:hypothetical protein
MIKRRGLIHLIAPFADTLARLQTALLDCRKETADPLLTTEGIAMMAASEVPTTSFKQPN